jgi:hypothetical protein
MPPTSFTSLFNGQPGYFNLGPYVSIDTVPDSASAWLQVRAWDARLGQTYDEVAALGLGGYGESTLFYADGGSPVGVDFAKPLIGLQSFSLVPEPATWSLLAFAGAILFWKFRARFSRTKQMKRLLTAVILLSVVHFADPVYSQASFVFANFHPHSSGANVNAPVFDADGNRLAGTDYVAMLYGGSSQNSLAPATIGGRVMDPVPLTYVPTGESGYFAQSGFVVIDTVPANDYAWLQVRAWDLRVGQTYDEVAARGLGGYGQSVLFYARGGDIFPPPATAPQPLRGLQSFSLVPEPGTWAMLALGVGILFWNCRHRRLLRQQP